MTLEKQRELTQEYLQNQGLREPLSIMSVQILEHLSRELVRLCDSVEKHGLVDYQMGVAEEEIMDRKYPCETAILLLVTIANVCVCCSADTMLEPTGSGQCDYRSGVVSVCVPGSIATTNRQSYSGTRPDE